MYRKTSIYDLEQRNNNNDNNGSNSNISNNNKIYSWRR